MGLKVFDPVIDGPARDPQAFGYVLHVVASIAPEQGLFEAGETRFWPTLSGGRGRRCAGAQVLAVVIGETWATAKARERALATQVEWKVGRTSQKAFSPSAARLTEVDLIGIPTFLRPHPMRMLAQCCIALRSILRLYHTDRPWDDDWALQYCWAKIRPTTQLQ